MGKRSVLLVLALLVAADGRRARADAYDPPAGYYNAATGTGATLKSQLYSITSTGFVGRSYGDSRYAFELLDQDPAAAGNILLIYNRASVDATWDSGVTFNREHLWPKTWLGVTSSQVTNSYIGVASDLFELRPSNPTINGDRGDEPYGNTATNAPHAYGLVSDATGTYWYPGDADRGDVSRAMFYMATRYGQNQANNLSLVNNQSSTYHMGDLASYLKWHFEDVPDTFERRRNQYIYSSSLNPNYYQGNRNPYVDHPEWVWSVFVNQQNDSRIYINGTVANSDGSSTLNVDLGRVFVGNSVPAAQSFTLNKSGTGGTYFQVMASGAATSSLSGRYNAMRSSQTDSKSLTVGLNTTTTTAGLKSGTVTVDNLDITTQGGAGRGGNDANDTFNVSLTVLDHSTPSFAAATPSTAITHDFGHVAVGGSAPEFHFDIHNLLATAGYTAEMDFDSFTPGGDAAAFTTDLAAAAGSLVLAGGASRTFTAALATTAVGSFAASYVLNFSDEDIVGALNKSLTLNLTGVSYLAGDYNGDLVVDASDYAAWRGTAGQLVAAFSGADGNGDGWIDEADFDVWRANFGQLVLGSGAAFTTADVPEPAGVLVAAFAVTAVVAGRHPRLVRPAG